MKSRNALTSKVAAAALAFSLAQSASAWAQDGAPDAEQAPQTNSQIQAQTVQPATPQAEISATGWSLGIDPLVPLLLLAGMGGLYGALCLYGASRKMRGAWLRVAAGSVLAVTLINPEIMTEEREMLPTEVVVVVDKSASQTLGGRDQTTKEAYEQVIRQLSQLKGVNIRTIEVDNEKDGAPRDGTNLFEALEANLNDVARDRLGAVILLTDGQVHDVPQDLQLLGKDVPLHVLLSGKAGEKDRRVVIDQAPRFGQTGQKQTIKFRVVDEGAGVDANGQVNVVISSEGREIARQRVTPGVQSEISVDLAHTGTNIIEITAEALAGELTEVNNRAVAKVEGVRESMNVLLISGTPDAGTRMWRDLIKADPDSNLVQFTVLRPPEKQDTTPLKELALIPFPTHEVFAQKLKSFDLVIFDHYSYDGLLPAAYLGYINNYVKEGGSLLVISGPDYAGAGSLFKTPLASILPAAPTGTVTEEPYRPQVNALGQRHPVTRYIQNNQPANTPWGNWMRIVDTVPNRGSVVMQGAGQKPLLYLDRQQKGRVAMLMSDSAWLWRMKYDGGGPSAALFGALSGWLTKAPAFEEESLNIRQQNGQVVIEQQTMAEKGEEITLQTPSGKTITVTPQQAEPGIWRAVLPATELGLYSARQTLGAVANTAFLNIAPASPKEYLNTVSTPDLLKPAVDKTPGTILRLVDRNGKLTVPRLEGRSAEQAEQGLKGSDWMGVRMSGADRLKGVSGTPLIPGWASMMLIVGLLAGAWYREGGGNLRQSLSRKKAPQPDNGPSL